MKNVKRHHPIKEITFRQVKPSDAKIASGLLFETFPKKATFIIGLGSETRAKKTIQKIFKLTGHRLSHEFAWMALMDGKILGLILAFPGKDLGRLNRRLDRLLLRQYPLRGKLALILRGWPLIFIKETERDAFFLSNLVVRGRYRGQGIGEILLRQVEEKAKDEGFSKVGLMVSIDNSKARRFYDRHGYKIKAINLESNRRVPYLGPGYQRRVKDLMA